MCERCGSAVVERVMRQWFLRITAYADRLLDGLERPGLARAGQAPAAAVDRPQSEGREIDFGDLTVFTTRPDTLPAVTFLAVPLGMPPPARPPAPADRRGAAGATRPTTSSATTAPARSWACQRTTSATPGSRKRNGIPISHAALLTPGDVVAGRPARRSATGCATGSSPASATGGRRSRSSTAPTADLLRCPTTSCRWHAARRRRLPADRHRPLAAGDRRRTGSALPAPTAARPRAARLTCQRHLRRLLLVLPALSIDRRSTIAHGTPSAPRGSCRSTSTPAGPSTCSAITSTPGSSRWRSTTSDWSRSRSRSPACASAASSSNEAPRCPRAAATSSRLTNTSPPTAPTSCAAPCSSAPRGRTAATSLDDGRRHRAVLRPAWRSSTVKMTPDADGSVMDRTIRDVSDAIERLAFNVAIARLMELPAPTFAAVTPRRTFVRLLAPFAPHLAEELWHRLGETFSVHTAAVASRRRCRPPSITHRDRRSDRRAPLRHHRGRPAINTGGDRRPGARAHHGRASRRPPPASRLRTRPPPQLRHPTQLSRACALRPPIHMGLAKSGRTTRSFPLPHRHRIRNTCQQSSGQAGPGGGCSPCERGVRAGPLNECQTARRSSCPAGAATGGQATPRSDRGTDAGDVSTAHHRVLPHRRPTAAATTG